MMYTTEEIMMLRENCKAVENWIRENIVPGVRESIKLEFGGITTRRGAYGFPVREREYEIGVTKDGVWGGSGGLSMRFADEKNYDGYKGSGTIFLYSDRGFAAPYIAALLQEWPRIKRELLFAVRQQESSVAAIRNFVL